MDMFNKMTIVAIAILIVMSIVLINNLSPSTISPFLYIFVSIQIFGVPFIIYVSLIYLISRYGAKNKKIAHSAIYLNIVALIISIVISGLLTIIISR